MGPGAQAGASRPQSVHPEPRAALLTLAGLRLNLRSHCTAVSVPSPPPLPPWPPSSPVHAAQRRAARGLFPGSHWPRSAFSPLPRGPHHVHFLAPLPTCSWLTLCPMSTHCYSPVTRGPPPPAPLPGPFNVPEACARAAWTPFQESRGGRRDVGSDPFRCSHVCPAHPCLEELKFLGSSVQGTGAGAHGTQRLIPHSQEQGPELPLPCCSVISPLALFVWSPMAVSPCPPQPVGEGRSCRPEGVACVLGCRLSSGGSAVVEKGLRQGS